MTERSLTREYDQTIHGEPQRAKMSVSVEYMSDRTGFLFSIDAKSFIDKSSRPAQIYRMIISTINMILYTHNKYIDCNGNGMGIVATITNIEFDLTMPSEYAITSLLSDIMLELITKLS